MLLAIVFIYNILFQIFSQACNLCSQLSPFQIPFDILSSRSSSEGGKILNLLFKYFESLVVLSQAVLDILRELDSDVSVSFKWCRAGLESELGQPADELECGFERV